MLLTPYYTHGKLYTIDNTMESYTHLIASSTVFVYRLHPTNLRSCNPLLILTSYGALGDILDERIYHNHVEVFLTNTTLRTTVRPPPRNSLYSE